MSYTHSNVSTDATALVSGDFTAGNLLTIINQAVRQVLAEVDLRSTIRKSALSPNLFDDIFEYSAPTDLKEDCIIDIQPQIDRARDLAWELVTPEEFDRFKLDISYTTDDDTSIETYSYSDKNLIAISNDDQARTLLIASKVDDVGTTIDTLDSITNWSGYGDGENLLSDTDDYVKGNASINWDIGSGGGTTAGIVNSSLDFDVTDYAGTGSIFTWVYISSTTNLTNFKIKVGSDSSNYYLMTATTKNDGTAFEVGWNLIRFDFSGKSETGSVDEDDCTYCSLYMTKDGAKVSETDYRFDQIIMKKGIHFYTKYYSKYGWVSNTGTRLENSTTTTDILMCDSSEYDMILDKTCELLESHLGNDDASAKFKKNYEDKRDKYIFKNPSQSMLLQQSY